MTCNSHRYLITHFHKQAPYKTKPHANLAYKHKIFTTFSSQYKPYITEAARYSTASNWMRNAALKPGNCLHDILQEAATMILKWAWWVPSVPVYFNVNLPPLAPDGSAVIAWLIAPTVRRCRLYCCCCQSLALCSYYQLYLLWDEIKRRWMLLSVQWSAWHSFFTLEPLFGDGVLPQPANLITVGEFIYNFLYQHWGELSIVHR